MNVPLVIVAILVLSATASCELITASNANKNITTIEIRTTYLGNNTYNFTVILYTVNKSGMSTEEEAVDSHAGKMMSPHIVLTPLPYKPITLNVGQKEFSGTTDEHGEYSSKEGVKISEGDVSGNNKCIEVSAEFGGDKDYEAAKSSITNICVSSALDLTQPIEDVVKEVSEKEEKANVCVMFFVFLGFLIAGLYASGADPFRLLDITTPRLPAARRKPEIRMKIEEDKLRNIRKWAEHAKAELDKLVEDSVRVVAKSIAKRENIDEKVVFREIMKAINEIKKKFKKDIESLRKSNIDRKTAATTEKDLIINMYAKIGNAIYEEARNRASTEVARDIEKTWIRGPEDSHSFKKRLPKGIKMAMQYALMQHTADLFHLVQRGPSNATGTVPEWRRKVEMVPIVGRMVNVVDNMINFGAVPLKYYKKKREISSSENELNKIKRERDDYIKSLIGRDLSPEEKKTMETLWNKQGPSPAEKFLEGREREFTQEELKEIREYQKRREISSSENELNKIEAERNDYIESRIGGDLSPEKKKTMETMWNKQGLSPAEKFLEGIIERELTQEELKEIREYHEKELKKREELEQKKAAPLMPDIVKSDKEMFLYVQHLISESINAANHLLLTEIKNAINKEEFDRFYGEILYERDLYKRNEKIKKKVEELERTDAIENALAESERIVNEMRRYSSAPYEHAREIIEFARGISDNPWKYDLIVATQDDEVRRYIELGEFVEEDVLKVFRDDGFTAGIDFFKKRAGIQGPDEIRDTHVKYKSSRRSTARIEDIKNDKEAFYFFLHSREFLRLIRYLDEKGILPKNIDRSQFERLGVYFARELAYLDAHVGTAITDKKELDERTNAVKKRTYNSLVEILKQNGIAEEKVQTTLKRAFDVVAEEAYSSESVSKIQKDFNEGILEEEAIRAWAEKRALDRMIGVTKPSGFEQDIVHLTNKFEAEYDAYEEMIEREKKYNNEGRQRYGIMYLNKLLGTVEDAENMNAQDVLMKMDADVRKVMLPALIRFFKNVKEGIEPGYEDCGGPAYEDLYEKRIIGGKEHFAIKGFVDPTEHDVIPLMKIQTKMLKHKEGQLLAEVLKELEQQKPYQLNKIREEAAEEVKAKMKGREDAQINAAIEEAQKKAVSDYAKNYLSFYGKLRGFGVLYHGLELPVGAAEKFTWIVEPTGIYKALGKERPYETMGPADKLLNYSLVRTESGELRLSREVGESWLRRFYDKLDTLANEIIGGSYIGIMAEARATTVLYTRHAEFIKAGVKAYSGAESSINDVEDLSKNVFKNRELANKLLNFYKWRVLLGKKRRMNADEFSHIASVINAEIKEGRYHSNKLLNDLLREADEIVKQDTKKIKDINELIAEAEKRRKYLEEKETLSKQEKDELSNILRNVGTSDKPGRLLLMREQLEKESKGLKDLITTMKTKDMNKEEDVDEVITAFSDYVGPYVMMEALNDIITKSPYRIEENEELLEACKDDIKLVDNVVSKIAKDIRKTLNNLPDHADELAAVKEIYKKVEKKVDEIKGVRAWLNDTKKEFEQRMSRMDAKGIDTTEIKTQISEINGSLEKIERVERMLEEVGKDLTATSTSLFENAKNRSELLEYAKGINSKNIAEMFGKINNVVGNMKESLSENGVVVSSLARASSKLKEAMKELNEVTSGEGVGARYVSSRLVALEGEEKAFANIENTVKLQGIVVDEVKKELEINIQPNVDTMSERRKKLEKMKERLEVDIKVDKIVSDPGVWNRLKIRFKYGMEFIRSLYLYRKAKAMEYDSQMVSTGVKMPKNDLLREVFEYSNKVRMAGAKRSELEKIVDLRMRNMAFIVDKFLDYAQDLYKSRQAGMHSRMAAFGLDTQSISGLQFSGPIASSLIQRMGTYGKYINRGWFTSVLLSYPIMKAQQMYKHRYAILTKFSHIPAVYAPMGKEQEGISVLQAYLYTAFKNKVARMGESLRSTAAGLPPPMYFPYLLTANPYGEVRMSEMLEIVGGYFRSTPRGPRDIINYELYRPNDLVMDFKDMIYTMKESRSMSKTPEHLMDVGIYGCASNTKFFAGREIEYFPSALGTGATMYPQRTFNALYYNPHLSLPGMIYTAYGDIYKRTQKPINVATEMIQLTAISKKNHLFPTLFMPSVILAIGGGMWLPVAVLTLYNYRRGTWGHMKQSYHTIKNYLNPQTDMWIRRKIEKRLMRGMYFGEEE